MGEKPPKAEVKKITPEETERDPEVEAKIDERKEILKKARITPEGKWQEILREFSLKQKERSEGKKPEGTGDVCREKKVEVRKPVEKLVQPEKPKTEPEIENQLKVIVDLIGKNKLSGKELEKILGPKEGKEFYNKVVEHLEKEKKQSKSESLVSKLGDKEY